MADFAPTHDELVTRAVSWLQGRGGCTFAFSEFRTGASWEIPDAIGFTAFSSIVIEVKTSRADFLKDRKKPFRNGLQTGMGLKRYFMAPRGLIEPGELPEGWGLLSVHKRNVRIEKRSAAFTDRNYHGEVGFLVSMLRRVEIRAVAQHRAAGNREWPADFLNQMIKAAPCASDDQQLGSGEQIRDLAGV